MTNYPNQHILSYLEAMPGYPFDPEIDADFLDEIREDFPDIELLEQIKTFRWHYDGRPDKQFKSVRPALRRWLAAARNYHSQLF